MSWWKNLLNRQSEMAAEVHNKAIEQPLFTPEHYASDDYIFQPALPVDITTRLSRLEERMIKLECLIVDMTADD